MVEQDSWDLITSVYIISRSNVNVGILVKKVFGVIFMAKASLEHPMMSYLRSSNTVKIYGKIAVKTLTGTSVNFLHPYFVTRRLKSHLGRI